MKKPKKAKADNSRLHKVMWDAVGLKSQEIIPAARNKEAPSLFYVEKLPGEDEYFVVNELHSVRASFWSDKNFFNESVRRIHGGEDSTLPVVLKIPSISETEVARAAIVLFVFPSGTAYPITIHRRPNGRPEFVPTIGAPMYRTLPARMQAEELNAMSVFLKRFEEVCDKASDVPAFWRFEFAVATGSLISDGVREYTDKKRTRAEMIEEINSNLRVDEGIECVGSLKGWYAAKLVTINGPGEEPNEA